MNGIIHNCTHGSDDDVGFMDEENMMVKILAYIDSLMRIIKPQQLLYMAIDGACCPFRPTARFIYPVSPRHGPCCPPPALSLAARACFNPPLPATALRDARRLYERCRCGATC
jgi:hypothetical protein